MIPLLRHAIAASLVCGLATFAACDKGQSSPPTTEPATDEKAEPEVPPPPTGPTGTIVGTVKFEGTAPEMPALLRGADPFCAQTEMKAETVVVNENGTLRNVLARVAPGEVPAVPAPEAPVVVDQVACMYRPRVQGGVVGQTISVKNSDGTMHNVHGRALALGERMGSQSLFNLGQPKGAPEATYDISKDVEVVALKCDVHGWMKGYVVVSDNPYFDTTGKDGSFRIENVPVGTHTMQVWHELYGVKTAEVTVEEGKEATVTVSYSPADNPMAEEKAASGTAAAKGSGD